MKTFPFLLLLACLLNTALSQPSGCGCWPFRRRVAVSQSASPAVSPGLPDLPDLPIDILLKIDSHADLMTKCSLRATNKGFKAVLSSLSSAERDDVERIKKSCGNFKAFSQAILKKDIDGVKRLYKDIDDDKNAVPEYMYGLELAVRYNIPEVAWILLACNKKTDTERRKKLRQDAEGKQTEIGLADIDIVQRAREGSNVREFYVNLILNRQESAYWLGLACELPEAVRKSGLHLAMRYGTNMNIFVLLAFCTSDWDMDSEENKELVKLAKRKLPQTYLDLLDQENSVQGKRDVWETMSVIRTYIAAIGATNVS